MSTTQIADHLAEAPNASNVIEQGDGGFTGVIAVTEHVVDVEYSDGRPTVELRSNHDVLEHIRTVLDRPTCASWERMQEIHDVIRAFAGTDLDRR